MYLGGDLSYVNEVEDSGGVFYDQNKKSEKNKNSEKSTPTDPFKILKDYGANIVRVRLWHTPTWTAYSDLADVLRTLRRAKALDMAVLLDFHYSDTWADPAKQIIPAAWANITDLATLESLMHDYTLAVLNKLAQENLTPEFVQVGNEINTEILMPGAYDNQPINWSRNVRLLNAGIKAVRASNENKNRQSQVMLHIAQPENIVPWFDDALAAGIADFDVIGMSYYPKWSKYNLDETGKIISEARKRYRKDLMVVETAYPWTLETNCVEEHLLGADAVVPDYPATPQGQYDFLTALVNTTAANGGTGVIYWEPAWISTTSKPSIWENAALFDYDNNAHKGIEFLSHRA